MVHRDSIRAVSARIVREFSPERIILFGSYAYGRPSESSDVDLMVVLPFRGRPFRKALEILQRVDPPFAVDLLASRPGDFRVRYSQGDPLIREALDHGEILYERGR